MVWLAMEEPAAEEAASDEAAADEAPPVAWEEAASVLEAAAEVAGMDEPLPAPETQEQSLSPAAVALARLKLGHFRAQLAAPTSICWRFLQGQDRSAVLVQPSEAAAVTMQEY